MKSEIKELAKSQIEISIEVSPEEMRPFLEKAAVKISQNSKIDGFRPGKAPYEVIKQKFGEMAILEEAMDEIISHSYYSVLKENGIIAVGQPKIEVEKMAPDNAFIFKAMVAVLPKVKIGDYSKIRLAREKIEIKDEQVEKIIDDIKKMRAKETLVEREAKIGDRLEINFEIFLDKVPIEHGQHDKYPITIGENRFIPGFEEQLVGMRANETKESNLKFPEDYYQKNLAGKNAEFRVKANAIYEVELPKADDEFAKNISAGKFPTMEGLKNNIRQNLEQEGKNKEEQRLEVELLDKIAAISEFEEIPDILIDNEKHKMVHELEDSIVSQGFNFEDYLKSVKKTHDELEKEFAPAAERRAKTSILCREIFQEQKMAVSDDEIEKEIVAIMKNYPANPEAEKQLRAETHKDYLKNVLGNRKVAEYLKSVIIK